VREPSAAVADKSIDHVDDVSARFIAASPLFMLATGSPDGSCDVSPRLGRAARTQPERRPDAGTAHRRRPAPRRTR
jgi:predicted pyridoxine 5'-phosphate oxidase superfamily flavin-nucleotide-binding protein